MQISQNMNSDNDREPGEEYKKDQIARESAPGQPAWRFKLVLQPPSVSPAFLPCVAFILIE